MTEGKYNTASMAESVALNASTEGLGATSDALYTDRVELRLEMVNGQKLAEELAKNGGSVEGASRMTDKLYE